MTARVPSQSLVREADHKIKGMSFRHPNRILPSIVRAAHQIYACLPD